MGSLAHCLRKHDSRLRPGEAAYLQQLAAEHEKRGLSPSAAAQAAVLDVMREELDTSRDIMRQVEAAGGEVPADFAAAVANLERTIADGIRVGPGDPSFDPTSIPDPAGLLDPEDRARARRDRDLAQLLGQGFTAAQVQVLRARPPDVPRDRVTGAYRAEELDPTLDAALRAVEGGEAAVYVEADLANLGGLNARLGASGADRHLQAFVQAIEAAMGELGPRRSTVVIRKGGDEVGIVVVGADQRRVEGAMRRARAAFEAHARREGLDTIPHPKGRAPGVSMHYGSATIRPGLGRGDILREADQLVERRKEGADYGDFGSVEADRLSARGSDAGAGAARGAGPGIPGDRDRERAEVGGARRGEGDGEGEAAEVGQFYREDRAATDGGLDREALRRLVEATTQRTGIPIRVVERPDDPSLPPRARGRQPKAQAYTDGRGVWLFAANLANVAHASSALAHEVVGHLGVEAITTAEDWQGISDAVVGLAEGDTAPAGFDGTRDAIREAWRRYPDLPTEARVREAVAVMAERGIAGTLWDRIEAAARHALRGLIPRLAWSPAELRALIARAARARPRATAEAFERDGDFFARDFDPDNPQHAEALLRSVPGRLPTGDGGWVQRVADAIDTARPTWLKALTRQQVVEVGKDVLPGVVDFERTARRMEADANALAEPSAQIAMRWSRLLFGVNANKPEAAALAALMHDATLYEIDPSKPIKDRPQISERAAYATLRKRWETLSPTAQQLYTDVRDAYAKRRAEFQQALEERIERAQMAPSKRTALRQKLRAEFEAAAARGPYFPLGRFGDFWVIGTRGADTTFVLAETQRQQREAMQDLENLGFTVRAGKKIQRLASEPPPGLGFIAEVSSLIDRAEIDRDLADQLRDDVYQLYLEALPEQSVRKSYIHRKGTPGFSQDALRVFSHHMTHGARQLARLRHADTLAGQLHRLAEAAPRAANPNKAADIVGALDSAYQWMMNPTTATWASRATSLGFAWYLGVSPAAALVNFTQQAMVTFPLLGSRYGFARAAQALAQANADYLRAVFRGERGKLEAERGGDVGKMLNELEASGAIDRTQTMSLAGLSDETAGRSIVEQRVLRVVGWAFQQVERLNREATALATYRLAREDKVLHGAAVEAAYDAVFQSHYDYSAGNRAAFMRGDIAKVALLFKQYAQNTTYFLARSVWEATKADAPEVRIEARRRLAAVVGMTGVFGGALGFPLASTLLGTLTVLVRLFGDDDDELDAEQAFRAWLVRTFGATWGEVAATGPANAGTGVDIASRTGMDPLGLWVRPPDRELEGKALALHYLEQAAGPVVGIAINAARGVDLIADGHALRGVEAMVPKAARDVMKAERFQREGVLSLRGDPIIDDPSLLDAWVQALGFTPAPVAEAYERVNAMRRLQARVEERRSRLMADYYRAANEPDPRKRAEAVIAGIGEIAAWNQRFPDVAITADQLRASFRQRQRLSTQAVDGAVVAPWVQRRFEAEPEPE